MRYILTSHGPYAKGALESVEMIIGKQENVDVLQVDHDSTLEDMTSNMKKVLDSYPDEEFVVFCDILGGTPSNASIKCLHEYSSMTVVTGYNLPVLIETFVGNYDDTRSLLEEIKKVHSQSLNIIEKEELALKEKVETDYDL